MPNPLQQAFVPLYRALAWPDANAYQHRQRQWMMKRMLDAIDAQGIRTVVEMGCGDGWVAHRLAERFERVVGYDINPVRIDRPTATNVVLAAAEAEHPPIAPGTADLIFSFAVFEHIPERPPVLRTLTDLLAPGGVMVHIVPTALMKLWQFAGFLPDKLRRELRNASRTLAGQKKHKPAKFYDGFETNNPRRVSRRAWHQKLYPRVHGEYDSNWHETLDNRVSAWSKLFTSTGLTLERVVPLGCCSPYFFGGFPIATRLSTLGPATVHGFILKRPNPS